MFGLAPRRILPLLALLPTLGLTAGGWAITSIDELPEHLVATRATPITFAVLGHGKDPIDGLDARIEARSGRTHLEVRAPRTAKGRYSAAVALPHDGEWALTVHNGFGRERVELLPITVIAPGATPPAPMPASDRGRRLFIAKGCVTCHERMDVGPRLAGRRYDPTWLGRFLDHPEQVRPAPAGRPKMPRLGLSQREIAALVAYVNTGSVAAGN